ncbi:hypothetical protein PENTCL1PPCAC_4075, partial [Pristionchus entomophagus]
LRYISVQKPKHSSATLRSPGIKPPRAKDSSGGGGNIEISSFAASFGHVGSSKSNTYTSRHTNHESQPKTAPPTPGYDTGDNRSPADSHAAGSSTISHGRSPHHSARPNAPPEDSVPAHFVLADVESRTRSRTAGASKTATLPRSGPPPSLAAPAASALAPPPPILPRRATTRPPSSAPSGAPAAAAPAAAVAAAAPPLHPRRATAASHGTSPSGAAGASSPSSSSTTRTMERPATFVFPSTTAAASGGSPPALPPRRRGAATEASAGPAEASSPVTLDSRLTLSPTTSSGAADEPSVSPTVSLSMPVPPALPPRRRAPGAGELAPPPLPPKMNQSPPNLQAPPLPPKTYKRRMHSASPTNLE